ncbi:MAG: carboxymuconolactone decarboxylase family protein [Alphaproteobacteria bacterium]|nr:carboxymuconolactone decarboxylase family protein [Alphaproteobacteria bacterium]
MPYLPPANVESASGQQKELFNQIQGAFGGVPNMFKTIGNSPAALEAMFGFFGALGKGRLGAKLGEQIAVLVADINRCEYCLAAHTVLGQKAGVSAETMAQAQSGKSADPKIQAALDFAAKLVKNRAQISAQDVQAVRDAGYNDEEISEILAHVALNIFTNYTNVAFDVEIDFPKVELKKAA